MNEPSILVALELRSYRETIAQVVGTMAPWAEVLLSVPEDLEREVTASHPVVVICSRIIPELEDEAPFWVEMYRDHGPTSTIKTPESSWEIEGMELSDLADVLSLLQCRSCSGQRAEGGPGEFNQTG